MKIRVPEPKAALIVHLLDRKMIEVAMVPDVMPQAFLPLRMPAFSD
jgi:hypothetical protein